MMLHVDFGGWVHCSMSLSQVDAAELCLRFAVSASGQLLSALFAVIQGLRQSCGMPAIIQFELQSECVP